MYVLFAIAVDRRQIWDARIRPDRLPLKWNGRENRMTLILSFEKICKSDRPNTRTRTVASSNNLGFHNMVLDEWRPQPSIETLISFTPERITFKKLKMFSRECIFKVKDASSWLKKKISTHPNWESYWTISTNFRSYEQTHDKTRPYIIIIIIRLIIHIHKI